MPMAAPGLLAVPTTAVPRLLYPSCTRCCWDDAIINGPNVDLMKNRSNEEQLTNCPRFWCKGRCFIRPVVRSHEPSAQARLLLREKQPAFALGPVERMGFGEVLMKGWFWLQHGHLSRCPRKCKSRAVKAVYLALSGQNWVCVGSGLSREFQLHFYPLRVLPVASAASDPQ